MYISCESIFHIQTTDILQTSLTYVNSYIFKPDVVLFMMIN